MRKTPRSVSQPDGYLCHLTGWSMETWRTWSSNARESPSPSWLPAWDRYPGQQIGGFYQPEMFDVFLNRQRLLVVNTGHGTGGGPGLHPDNLFGDAIPDGALISWKFSWNLTKQRNHCWNWSQYVFNCPKFQCYLSQSIAMGRPGIRGTYIDGKIHNQGHW